MAQRKARGPFLVDMRKHYVYELWGAKECLYVGVSGSLPNRLSAHMSKYWWGEVVRIEIRVVHGRSAGLDLEQERIQALDPVHNIYLTRRAKESHG